MLEFLRRQSKPIMIAVAAIIIIAFTFWSGMTQPSQGGLKGEDTAITINGKDYSFIQMHQLQRTFPLAQDLPGVGPSYGQEIVGLHFQHVSQKTGRALRYVESAPFDYGINVLVLRDALKRFGIRASDAEVQNAYRALPAFSPNGQYNPELAREVEQNLRKRGITEEQMYETIRDSLGLQRLSQLVAGNVVSEPSITDRYYAMQYSTIKAATIPFPLEDFKKKVEVKDEDISKYFEENKDGYKTEEKRAVTLVVLPKPDTATLNAENTVKAQREYEEKVQKFAEKVLEPNINLAAEATAAKAEVRQIAAFADSAPPEELKSELGLVNAIFSNDPKKLTISDPVRASKGYAFFQVTAVEEPKPQELKDVKDKIRDALVDQKATEAMTKAANEARTKLEAAIKGGKSFADAAKEAGLTPQVLAEFSAVNPPMDLSIGYQIAQEAQLTAPGNFAKDILNSENGVLLLFVLSKELRKNPESGSTKNMFGTNLDRRARNDILLAWFEEQYKNAGVNVSTMLGDALRSER